MDLAVVEVRLIVVSALLEREGGGGAVEPCCFGATEGSVEQQEQCGVSEAHRQVHFAALCSSRQPPIQQVRKKKAHLSRGRPTLDPRLESSIASPLLLPPPLPPQSIAAGVFMVRAWGKKERKGKRKKTLPVMHFSWQQLLIGPVVHGLAVSPSPTSG